MSGSHVEFWGQVDVWSLLCTSLERGNSNFHVQIGCTKILLLCFVLKNICKIAGHFWDVAIKPYLSIKKKKSLRNYIFRKTLLENIDAGVVFIYQCLYIFSMLDQRCIALKKNNSQCLKNNPHNVLNTSVKSENCEFNVF